MTTSDEMTSEFSVNIIFRYFRIEMHQEGAMHWRRVQKIRDEKPDDRCLACVQG